MKKILHILLFSLAPVLVFAQPSPPSPAAATQAEVNAGVVPNKYVSPKTLAGWTGGGGGGGGTPGGASGDWQKNVAGSFGGVTPTSGWDTLFGAPSSANLYAWMSDETGSGIGALLVFNSSPTIASPTLTGTTTVSTLATTTLTASTLEPTTNDGAPLGSTSKQWSDLFLAEGGVINWDNGDATLTQVGDVVTLGGAGLTISQTTSLLLGTAGSAVGNIGFRNATSGTITLAPPTGALGTVTVTLPAATDTLVGKATTDTLTNKTITPRITTVTSSGTPTYNTDSTDCLTITAQAAAITSMTSSRTGTINNFQQLEIRIKDDGTARAITWGADFSSGIATLPTTTTLGKTLVVYLEGDTVTGDFMCMATGSYP